MTARLLAKRAEQAGKHLTGLDAECGEFAVCVGIEVAQAGSQGELVFDLPAGGIGDVQEVQVVGLGVAGTPFDDVRWHRNRRTSQLRGQAENLLPRKTACVPVDRQRQAVGQLKCLQLPVVAHTDDVPGLPAVQWRLSSGTKVVSTPTNGPKEDATMKTFLARHASLVTCVLSGFDRLVLRGTLLPLMRERAMHVFLSRANVRWLDCKAFALRTTERVKCVALAEAQRNDRPVRYLESSRTDKEKLARTLLAEHPLEKPGLICSFTVVEPCMSFEYHRAQDPQERGLKLRPRKCLDVYNYLFHPTFGFMNVRIQTWFPFNVQICLNGREWLARQLERRHSGFKRADNCFPWLANPALAQRLMDEQLDTDWPAALTTIARSINPLHGEIFAPWPMDYYWSGYQMEWATDIVFKDAGALGAIYPALVRHAVDHFKSPDVMRFLGQKLHGNFKGEVITSFKERPEGVRVKHFVRGNSIKMYDKAGNILRLETTTARTNDFKVLRPLRDDYPAEKLAWRPLRKGVADLHRRAEVSQRSNERYLQALAAVDDTTPCSRLFDAVSRPVMDDGRHFRAMRLSDPCDLVLFETISRGEFVTAGFRNRDLRAHLYSPPKTPVDQRRLSGKVSRQLRLLRAHGVIRKIPKTHRYQLTERGRLLTAALRATRDASIQQLLRDAA